MAHAHTPLRVMTAMEIASRMGTAMEFATRLKSRAAWIQPPATTQLKPRMMMVRVHLLNPDTIVTGCALWMPTEMAFAMNLKSAAARMWLLATSMRHRQRTMEHVIFAHA